MNNCIAGYLHLDVCTNIEFFETSDFDDGFEGNTKEYIDKLEFSKSGKFNLDEEWDNFCDHFFNNWNAEISFYRELDGWVDVADEFNSKEMIWLLRETNKYWLNTGGSPYTHDEVSGACDEGMFEDEERLWNNIAYYWIRERSDNIKAFVLKKIQERFDEWLEDQKDEGNYPLSCDICYKNKPIETYTACCNDKKFCGPCYKKVQKKPCPFCRGQLNHKIDEDIVCDKPGFQDWLFKFKNVQPFIKKRRIIRLQKKNIPPFQRWKERIMEVNSELLYKAFRCWHHKWGCRCHLENQKILNFCLKSGENGNICQVICVNGYKYCKSCLEQDLGMI
jgi:hypothetical protein